MGAALESGENDVFTQSDDRVGHVESRKTLEEVVRTVKFLNGLHDCMLSCPYNENNHRNQGVHRKGIWGLAGSIILFTLKSSKFLQVRDAVTFTLSPQLPGQWLARQARE